MQTKQKRTNQDNQEGFNLTPKQIQGVSLLLSGTSINEICSQLEIGRITFWEWRRLPEFRAYFNRLQSNLVAEETQKLSNLRSKSISVLNKYLDDNTNPELQVKIALKVLETVQENSSWDETDPESIQYNEEIFNNIQSALNSLSDIKK